MSHNRNDCRIYVGNLPPDIRTKDIQDLFYKFGKVTFVDLKNRRGPPFAFMEFKDPRDADDAVHARDGYDYDGYRFRVEFPRGGEPSLRGREGGSGGGGRNRGPPARRSQFRVLVTGLPPSGSWQDLKDHMREAGDVCFADAFKDGSGVVEFLGYEDMKYANKKLDDSRFRSHENMAHIAEKLAIPTIEWFRVLPGDFTLSKDMFPNVDIENNNPEHAIPSTSTRQGAKKVFTPRSQESDENVNYLHGLLEEFPCDASIQEDLTPNICNTTTSTGALSQDNLRNETDIRKAINRITSDKSLIYTGPAIRTDNRPRKIVIMNKIYRELKKLKIEALKKNPTLFTVRKRRRWNNTVFENGRFKLKNYETATTTKIQYDSAKGRLKFVLIFRLMKKMYFLLKNNAICTTREIYYQLLGRNQIKKHTINGPYQIRAAIDTISSILEVAPWYLPIVSTSKGLVYAFIGTQRNG